MKVAFAVLCGVIDGSMAVILQINRKHRYAVNVDRNVFDECEALPTLINAMLLILVLKAVFLIEPVSKKGRGEFLSRA